MQAQPAADAEADAVEATETDLSAPAADELDGGTDVQPAEEIDDADDSAVAGVGSAALNTRTAFSVQRCLTPASQLPG